MKGTAYCVLRSEDCKPSVRCWYAVRSTQWRFVALPAPTRLIVVRRFRQVAFAILFGGWMLPAFLAQSARARAPRSAHLPQAPLEVVGGVAPPPAPAERLASMFTMIAVLWFLTALVYATVLTVRLRRTLVS